VTAFLYDACRPEDGSDPVAFVPSNPKAEGGLVSFVDFCGSIGSGEISNAVTCAVAALLAFFPDIGPKDDKSPFAGADGVAPENSSPGPGNESTALQP